MIQYNSKFLNCIIFNGKKYIPVNISPKNTSLRILLNDDNLTFGIHSMSIRKNNTVVVDWGDGTQDTYNNVPLIHTYSQSGEYLVSISDGITNINVTNGDVQYNPNALVEICSFGTKLSTIDLSRCAQIPILRSTTSVINLPAEYRILVPDELYVQWIAADNWKDPNIRSHIVKYSNKDKS